MFPPPPSSSTLLSLSLASPPTACPQICIQFDHAEFDPDVYRIKKNDTGDFRFVIIQEFLSNENELPWKEQLVLSIYLTVKGWVSSPKNWFGLDSDSVDMEQAPLILEPVKAVGLKRVGK